MSLFRNIKKKQIVLFDERAFLKTKRIKILFEKKSTPNGNYFKQYVWNSILHELNRQELIID